ncbi:endonuclease/exonuclease/phosphatase family protein [Geminicoccaceae bacterium 1502E]|nr:endonuclease/exonuclease/phosphatase family protein [Geminicoccaceae bacterium 1502E]
MAGDPLGATDPTGRWLMRVVSYNVHACRGIDRRVDIERVAKVLRRIDADVIGLQEVEGRPRRSRLDQAQELAERLGMTCHDGPMLIDGEGGFGNALLTRLPTVAVAKLRFRHVCLEPRGLLDAELRGPDGRRWRVIVTHLDLKARCRERHILRLAGMLRRGPRLPTVVLGDFNEWRPCARALGRLDEVADQLFKLRTFPSWAPVLPLDRMVLRHCRARRKPQVWTSPLARLASDHLPVVADLVAVSHRDSNTVGSTASQS